MNRDEKIAALKRVLDGESIKDVFPPIVLVILENGPDKRPDICTMPGGHLDRKGIAWNDLEGVKAAFKAQNPNKRLKITHLSKEENDAFDAWFEENF